MVELKVVQGLFENFAIHTVFVPVSLVGLLPTEIDKHVFRVVMLHPLASVSHDPTDEGRVVAESYEILHCIHLTLCFSSPKTLEVVRATLLLTLYRVRCSLGAMLTFRRSGLLDGLFLDRSSEYMNTYIVSLGYFAHELTNFILIHSDNFIYISLIYHFSTPFGTVPRHCPGRIIRSPSLSAQLPCHKPMIYSTS